MQTNPNNVDFWVEIVNDHGSTPRDNYLLRSYNNLPLSNGALVDHIAWQLDDSTATALSSTDLPTLPPVLEDWESIFGLTMEGYGYFIRAHVTDAQLEPGNTCRVPQLQISPASGTFAESQSFDLALILRPDIPIVGATATLDGTDVVVSLRQCAIPGTLVEGGRSFRCPAISLGHLGPGEHTLRVTFNI